MKTATRRELIYGAGASLVALAGCSSTQREGQTGELVSDTVEIEPGDHRRFDFFASSNVFFTYSFTVTEGPPIDVILMRAHGYADYTDGNEFVYYQDGSTMDSTGESVEIGLSEDNKYYLVLDNTSQGEADPTAGSEPTVATVEIEAAIDPV